MGGSDAIRRDVKEQRTDCGFSIEILLGSVE